jgi:putative CocE/NonD family hydrolase
MSRIKFSAYPKTKYALKAWILIVYCLLIIQVAFSQKLPFPRANYSNNETLKNSISGLAKEVISYYRKKDKNGYFDNMVRLHLAARSYTAANDYLDSLAMDKIASGADPAAVKGMNFHYRIFSAARQNNRDNMITKASYQAHFTAAYLSLAIAGERYADRLFLETDLPYEMKALEKTINPLQNKDSITVNEALQLCRTYIDYSVYSETLLFGKEAIGRISSKRYFGNDSIILKMPDGGTVAVSFLGSKTNKGRQPAVLLYDIYAGDERHYCKVSVDKGYVGVVVNTRGKRLSKDVVEPFEHDGKDAYYIIDWISKQPWCNGKVGMYGGSYLGFAQWSTAKYLHPALKTIVPQVSVGAGIDYPMQNGIFMSYALQWLYFVTDTKLTDYVGFSNQKKWDNVYGKWYQTGTSFRSLDSLEGRLHQIFQRWLEHPGYDDFWKNMTPQKDEFAKINIPILSTTGYWDDDQLGAMYYYRQYHLWNKNPDYYLIIGPYDHFGAQGRPRKTMGGYTIDSVANIPITNIIFQWFDYILKDGAKPAILKDKVNFQIMGTNKWKHVSSLDKMHNDSITYYLGASPTDNKYPLLRSNTMPPAYISQVVDMTDRSEMRFKHGNIDAFPLLVDTALNPEKEKLIFISEPVETPFAISGALSASITLSINKKDVDLVIDLYEQTADGHFLALNENVQRASYTRDRTKRQLLQPDQIETIRFDNTYITSRLLSKGSRLVVTLGVNKSPAWQINYGTGKDVSDETIGDAGVPLEIHWYNNSFIRLPVLR